MAGGSQPLPWASRDRAVLCGWIHGHLPDSGHQGREGRGPAQEHRAVDTSACPRCPFCPHAWPSVCFAFLTNQALFEDRAWTLALPEAAAVTQLLTSLNCEVALASPKPWWAREMRGRHPTRPLLLDRLPPPPSRPSARCPSGRPAGSRRGNEDALGPGAGTAGARAERMLILGACGQRCPRRACAAPAEPPLCRGPRLAVGQSPGVEGARPDAAGPRDHLPRCPSRPLPAPRPPPRAVRGGGG